MTGKTLGHYQITSQLGKGGMGEVFQAKDQILGRDVAIKVLPEEFAKDVDRVARFQREAKVLASLNHPNIASIYGLEESGGTNFLVLELVEGETLADLIKANPIQVENALKIALQIAEALETAHEKGVIHRDLKPANIKVTPDGKVKVLDFGLAKAYAGEQEPLNLSNSPTLSDAATQQGIIMGTAAYMSPEQAKGKTVDKRADVFAFGVVLFETLTGQQLFTGETVSETLAAVLMKEPDFSILPKNLHPRIRLLLERCLKKDLRDRYGSISDGRVDIQNVLADPNGLFIQPATGAAPKSKLRTTLSWLEAILLTAVIVGTAVWILKPTPAIEPRQITRFTHELPKDQQFRDLVERALTVSPDGRQIIYSANGKLYLRPLDELNATVISGTGDNPQKPFFSPDGKWVGYIEGNQLCKIAIGGGAPIVLADAATVGFIDWGADDTIVFCQVGTGIMRISANGGTPETIIKKREIIYAPQILPDGKSVLFTVGISPYKIMVQSLKSGEQKELFEGDTAKYLPTGHIVYAVGNNLFAVPFDIKTLKVAGTSVPIIENVLRTGGAPQYAVSDSGTMAYMPEMTGSSDSGRTLVWVDRDGKEEVLPVEPHEYTSVRISPDGTKLALHFPTSGHRGIWIWDLVRKTLTQLTLDASQAIYPLWAPGGKRVAFASDRDGKFKIYWKSADGTGKDVSVAMDLVPGKQGIPAAWSSDGKTLVLMETNLTDSSNADIGALSMEADHKYRPLLTEKYNEFQPQISPNGRWMAYTSDESGQAQIYVRPFPELDEGRWLVSTSGGDSPLWSKDGRELFYHRSNAVMVAPVKAGATFSFETPRPIFQGTYFFPSGDLARPYALYPWDISPDGKHFLMIRPPGTTSAEGGPRKINIVLNWFEELKRRVPVK